MSARSPADTLALEFDVRQGMAQLFERAMRDGRTPPLSALETIAGALGSVYREVAAVHLDPGGCPCGWQPSDGDLRVLIDALLSGARPERPALPNLGAMEPAGRA